ncbi:M20 family metallopeptidase [Dactylosporangium cerinum]|uniref:M20 family metallopeptidase n=1 Tax=Dactylosporangium cerinum TaxID=1434730 RepID=A0ABV9VPU5_9ACTN
MGLREDLIELRRDLHRHPEIGLDLPHTQRRVLAALEGLPLEVSTGTALSSVTAVLRGGRPGPVVLLRGDMDALPVAELADVPFASAVPGVMHACGHDLHTAGLVGAAHLLAARREELAGDVVFMFQPGEEGHNGAGLMIDEGVLEAAGRPADAAYGLHVVTDFPRGVFAGRPGPLMSAAAGLFVRVVGAGGHGSAPHDARDPIPAACEMVLALQTMVGRRFSPFEPVVVTVGAFHAGTLRNVIPDEAVFEATVRTFSADAAKQIAEDSVRLCEGIAAAHGLHADVRFETEYPVTVNDDAEFAFVADTVTGLFGTDRFHHMEHPDPGSEDFSLVLQRVPGAYLFLGAAGGDDQPVVHHNHSPRVVFDDDVLYDGAVLLAALAERRLARRVTEAS